MQNITLICLCRITAVTYLQLCVKVHINKEWEIMQISTRRENPSWQNALQRTVTTQRMQLVATYQYVTKQCNTAQQQHSVRTWQHITTQWQQQECKHNTMDVGNTLVQHIIHLSVVKTTKYFNSSSVLTYLKSVRVRVHLHNRNITQLRVKLALW